MNKILQELSDTTSTNTKISILTKYKDNELFKRVLAMAMDTVKYNYYVRKYPEVTTHLGTMELSEALDNLLELPRGNSGIDKVVYILSRLSEDDAEVFRRVVNRDLKIGIGKTIVNKVFKNLITKPPYMRCSVFSRGYKKIKYPALIQEKCDGLYQMVTVQDSKVSFTSRSGEERNFPRLEKEFSKLADGIYIGELLIDGITNRAESNGIVNSDRVGDYPVYMVVWDYLTDFGDLTKYSKRLDSIDLGDSTRIHLIPTFIVRSEEEALRVASSFMEEGKEGAVLKDFGNIFKSHTSPTQVKIKLVVDTTVRIVGFTEGTKGTKREGKVGAIVFATDDLAIQGQTSGFSDQLLDYITEHKEQLLHTFMDVTFNDISQAQGNNYYALVHPRFKGFRNDIADTDTFERIQELIKMAKGL